MSRHRRALAVAMLALGALAAIVRTPVPQESGVDVAALARAVEREDDHVTAIELATWIKDRKPGLRVIDVRSAAEFDNFHLPTAERIPLDALGVFRDVSFVLLAGRFEDFHRFRSLILFAVHRGEVQGRERGEFVVLRGVLRDKGAEVVHRAALVPGEPKSFAAGH